MQRRIVISTDGETVNIDSCELSFLEVTAVLQGLLEVMKAGHNIIKNPGLVTGSWCSSKLDELREELTRPEGKSGKPKDVEA